MKPEAVQLPQQTTVTDHRTPAEQVAPDGVSGQPKPALERAAARDRRDSRWDEHRRARRAALVDAAVVAVGKHGAGVGMDEIAAEAGTSKTVVYRHFADRSDLHVAVCTRVAEQLLPTLRAAMRSSDQPRDMLGAAVEAYLAFLEADPELYRFVVHGQSGTADTDDPITGLSDLVGDQAAAILAPALEQAGRDPVAAAPWGHAVVGLVRAAADWWLRAGRPMPRRDLAAHLTDLAWAGLSGVVTTEPRKEEL
ncbi:TetR/AcrR family transcriptional regulator [Blastococcus sp. VKM Ac-2987]|uniref:TetR/AcrR family transcriptional regulator n=1 Tax=Blastococcus sp. VKM Ac-2987 TaxID=3004141 RepID=UPI0022AB4FE1|nr:TetR/AcrR family transcriptional regulator [Blastococcus sp. VKM Ac-2987]MCZ2858548.1 TetR/AcrR family transcriptional regulator [Blastococcus sp. VKM Ac-2987]